MYTRTSKAKYSQRVKMKFKEISSKVGHIPFISKENGQFLYDLIIKEKITNILELGIAHGTATCYMAAALQEQGEGKITAVDLIEVKDQFKPSAEEQLAKNGFADIATVKRMQTGYTWFLHDQIVKNTKDDICHEEYDLVIIDGPKNWTIDGAAFFFADKLLKKNGWIIFDDYNWTYSQASDRRDATDGITHRSLSQAEQETPHIKAVFELLVKQHPHYGNLIVLEEHDWVLAQKTMSADKTYNIVNQTTTKDMLGKGLAKIYKKYQALRKG